MVVLQHPLEQLAPTGLDGKRRVFVVLERKGPGEVRPGEIDADAVGQAVLVRVRVQGIGLTPIQHAPHSVSTGDCRVFPFQVR